MTDRYTFDPILLDASPMPSRFVAPLGESSGIWFCDCPVDSRHIVWHRGQPISIVIEAGHLVYVGHPQGSDLALRPRRRRRGQRPAGTPRSEWWVQRRGKRRQIGGVP